MIATSGTGASVGRRTRARREAAARWRKDGKYFEFFMSELERIRMVKGFGGSENYD